MNEFLNAYFYLPETVLCVKIDQKNEKATKNKAIFYFDDGSIYKGEFKDGKQHGNGILTWLSGDKYEGGWLDGKKHGNGRLDLTDGEKHIGQFRDDKKNGKGICYTKEGNSHEGDWLDNKRHGHGIIQTADGSVKYSGIWIQGKPIFASDDTNMVFIP
jgi:hypothetical protein